MIGETLREGTALIQRPELWSLLPIAFSAAILRIKYPDRITHHKTKKQSGPPPDGQAQQGSDGVADYLFIPTDACVWCDVNDGDKPLKIKDNDKPGSNIQVNQGGRVLHQTGKVMTSPQPVKDRPNMSVVYLGPVDNRDAYRAFMMALSRLNG